MFKNDVFTFIGIYVGVYCHPQFQSEIKLCSIFILLAKLSSETKETGLLLSRWYDIVFVNEHL